MVAMVATEWLWCCQKRRWVRPPKRAKLPILVLPRLTTAGVMGTLPTLHHAVTSAGFCRHRREKLLVGSCSTDNSRETTYSAVGTTAVASKGFC